MDAKFPSHLRGYRGVKYSQNQLLEDNERLLEYERIRLAKLHFARKHQGNPCHVIDSANGLRPSENRANLRSAECFNYLLDLLASGSVTRDQEINSSEAEYTNNTYSEGSSSSGKPVHIQVDNTQT
ncbi:hypothetical protein MLD38_034270 [Melastoma candidum]|uniref:Uncharacterized protein n=1 Tax=Melastoma candidum TaxID=119954 RepID=A0ACB9MDM6_9MYRT|nr:hypothetical protein MLD38_034270 [Melastoma candidum]